MTCECAVCQYYREYEQHIAQLTGDTKAFFEDMYERLCIAETDAAFNGMMRKQAEQKAAEASWITNPDRMGGQYTIDETVDRGWS